MINKYEILQKVGNGNFSNVYLVRKKENNDCFAMKIMKTHQNIGVREAEFLKTFDHPNIVKLYDF
jgi:serine/threonine protein kinase